MALERGPGAELGPQAQAQDQASRDALIGGAPVRESASGEQNAPGAPGLEPTWTSSAKDLVTSAHGPSRVWVTLGHGVLNEVYWPSTGEPQIRDLSFIVKTPTGWTDLKREARYDLSQPRPDVPLLTVTHTGAGFTLRLTTVPDPLRDVVLIRYALEGEGRLYALLAPHLGGSGKDNTAWADAEGISAERGGRALALRGSAGFSRASVGFVGVSDGWQDFERHGEMTWTYPRAEGGNVAALAELPAQTGVLALGFAYSARGAHTLASSSLAEGWEAAAARFRREWEAWGDALELPVGEGAAESDFARAARLSAMILKVHEDTSFPGAVVASLSIPWGNSRDDLGGYHLVWPRDAALSGFALLAANQLDDARRLLCYLVSAQHPDGHWAQNFYPNGLSYWHGIQLDETGFPILLAAKLRERGDLGEVVGLSEMVRGAARYLAVHGPLSPQDRWEENAGANPFTLAVMIAALVAASAWLDQDERAYALSLADSWNERVEEWTFVENTDLARAHGVKGYYVRLSHGEEGIGGQVELQNRAGLSVPASALVSLDYGYLGRLGLRDPAQERFTDTLRVVNAVLRVSTPSGDLYHRYNEDGYGEHADGSPYDGTGIGRLWPLLTGEAGHLALLRGEDVTPYLQTMLNCAGPGGLLPEQVWDTAPIPEKGLFPGRPTGSAMPLLWTHAEFLKLFLARALGAPAELLESVRQRYDFTRPQSATWHWRSEVPIPKLPQGRDLLIEDRAPFTLHFGWDGWQEVQERDAESLPFGLWGVRFAAAELAGHTAINFTRRNAQGWSGHDDQVGLGHAEGQQALKNM